MKLATERLHGGLIYHIVGTEVYVLPKFFIEEYFDNAHEALVAGLTATEVALKNYKRDCAGKRLALRQYERFLAVIAKD